MKFGLSVWLLAVAHAFETLVVYDSAYSDDIELQLPQAVTNLADLGLITYKEYSDSDVKLVPEVWDGVVLMPKQKGKNTNSAYSAAGLLEFTNAGGNVLVVGSSDGVVPEGMRQYLNELGIYPLPKGFQLHDYFHASSSGEGVKLTADDIDTTAKLGEVLTKLAVKDYQGGAALLSNNPLLFPLVRGSKTSFTSKDGLVDDQTWTYGTQGFPAVALQALNNARVVWVGDISLVLSEVVLWVFQQRQVLKLQFVNHVKAEEPHISEPHLYRVKDGAIYTVGVLKLEDGQWVPYEALEERPLQMLFKMLDPYQRLNMTPLGPVLLKDNNVNDAFAYLVNFTVPDHHGMFTFELDYKYPGYSYLHDAKVVTVRHLANDEYKRLWEISNSWMYVASALLVVVAWFLFVVNYIYVGTPTTPSKKNV